MSLNVGYGFQNLLKEGHKHFSGLDEAILKNINACKEISNITKTSLGPNGMKKMVINHLDKIFVTSDAATIMRELEVQHPAAKMIVMASKMQEGECGDATNFVLAFAGELLNQADSLIRMGLHCSQIITGYELALKKTIEHLESLTCYEVKDPRDTESVINGIRASLTSKLLGYGDQFANIITEACQKSLPRNAKEFDIESVRVAKILGASVEDSFVINGLIVHRGAEGSITQVKNPKICAFGQPLDPANIETKGTVLIQNKEDLLNYTKSEEEFAEKIVKKIAESGVTLVIAGGSIAEIVMHYFEKYRIMVVRIMSKFELKRLCKAFGCAALSRLDSPTPEEMGTADEVYIKEIGSDKVVVFQKNNEDCKLNTIVLRGSTSNLLDDLERAIEDGVNNFRNLLQDGRYLPGAGSTEAILVHKLEQDAKSLEDLSQYAFLRYGQSFEIIPRILSDNCGLNTNETIPKMNSLNKEQPHGINIETGQISPISEIKVYDHLKTKWWAIKLATDAAITILRVDQIIIAKQSGGPKVPQTNPNYDE